MSPYLFSMSCLISVHMMIAEHWRSSLHFIKLVKMWVQGGNKAVTPKLF